MAPLYIANDDDWEQDEHGNLVLVAEYEDESWGGEEDDEAPPAILATRGLDQRPPEARNRISDVAPEVYWDDSALVNCWAAALVDFKYHHPSQFSPLAEAPRTARQKSLAAPLWFGPVSAPPAPESTVSEPNASTKKRSKRARKLDAAKRRKLDTPGSPTWSPRSPEFQREPSPFTSVPSTLVPASTSPSAALLPPPQPPAPTITSPPTSLPVAGPQLPTCPSSFGPPPPPVLNGLLPRSYPRPPPIVPLDSDPLDSDDAPLGTETPEELLRNALWSWYNAGYQTALYYASVGAAASEES